MSDSELHGENNLRTDPEYVDWLEQELIWAYNRIIGDEGAVRWNQEQAGWRVWNGQKKIRRNRWGGETA